ncbi:MAG: hypothetical protein ACI8XM_000107 [Haloarculaceae archaeon]|jgi:hypothetical protein
MTSRPVSRADDVPKRRVRSLPGNVTGFPDAARVDVGPTVNTFEPSRGVAVFQLGPHLKLQATHSAALASERGSNFLESMSARYRGDQSSAGNWRPSERCSNHQRLGSGRMGMETSSSPVPNGIRCRCPLETNGKVPGQEADTTPLDRRVTDG